MHIANYSAATLTELTAEADSTFHADTRAALKTGPIISSGQLLDLPVPEQGGVSFAMEIQKSRFYALATKHIPDEFSLSLRRNATIVLPSIWRL